MVNILNNNEKLTPYVFYSRFLKEVAVDIQNNNDIHFKFVENGDEKIFDSTYTIEPITIPLILSLAEQLSKFYSKPIDLFLYNNHATKKVLKFLYKSDFFNLSGNNSNPSYPIGRNILKFNEQYLGDFIKKDPRPEHKVRCYSLNERNHNKKLEQFIRDDEKRDFLVSEYVYIVRDHSQELLFENFLVIMLILGLQPWQVSLQNVQVLQTRSVMGHWDWHCYRQCKNDPLAAIWNWPPELN